MRGVTDTAYRGFRRVLISTRTPHAGSDAIAEIVRRVAVISTRTPHAGSDSRLRRIAHALLISTRTPHAGSDVDDLSHISEHCQFQPALPMRGVTYHFAAGDSAKQISTRTPHAGSDNYNAQIEQYRQDFNPHSPCGE